MAFGEMYEQMKRRRKKPGMKRRNLRREAREEGESYAHEKAEYASQNRGMKQNSNGSDEREY